MKTKFYLLLTFVFFILTATAQKYNVSYLGYWTNNTWTDTLKTTNTYDSNGHLIKITAQAPNPQTRAWEDYYIINYSRNSDATVQQMLIQAWDPDSKTWLNATKTMFTYSATKKLLSQTTQLALGSIWMDLAKTTYTYNANDQLATQVEQVLNPLTMQLVNSEQIIYTYNPDGTVSRHEDQIWNGQWVNSKRSSNTYDSAKKLTSLLEEKFENQTWLRESNTTIKYNARDSISESLMQTWVNNAWVNASLELYSYDLNHNLSQIIYQEWNTTTSQWVNQGRIRYDYSTAINSIELAENPWVVFPNPFYEQVTIENRLMGKFGIQVFNANGQLIKSFTTNESISSLNLGELKKGVYFMKIKSSQNEQTLKLLKAR